MNLSTTILSLLLLKGFLAFVSTNMDDLILLIIFLRENNSRTSKKHVILSQYLSFLIIIAVSILGSFSKFILPLNQIGWLGLVPIIYGIRRLAPKKPFYGKDTRLTFFTMTSLALGDGLDNISTYTVLFVSETPLHICILSGYFLLLLAVWYWVGSALANTSIVMLLAHKIRQAIPFIYIGLGFLIMYENRTLALLFCFVRGFLGYFRN